MFLLAIEQEQHVIVEIMPFVAGDLRIERIDVQRADISFGIWIGRKKAAGAKQRTYTAPSSLLRFLTCQRFLRKSFSRSGMTKTIVFSMKVS